MLELQRPLSTLICLGNNQGPPFSEDASLRDPDHLSIASKVIIHAATQIPTETIIFSSGPTSGPKYNSEAYYMQQYLFKRYPRVFPQSAVFLEDTSLDTIGNGIESARLVREMSLGENIGVLSTKIHAENFALITARQGFHIPAENVLSAEMVLYRQYLKESKQKADDFWKDYDFYALISGKEAHEHLRHFTLNTFDWHGRAMQFISESMRNHEKFFPKLRTVSKNFIGLLSYYKGVLFP